MKRKQNLQQPFQLADFISRIEADIFDEKIWMQEKMRKIAEVTYSYKNIKRGEQVYHVNYTLFCEIWELDFDAFSTEIDGKKQESMLQDASNLLTKKIQEKREAIEQYISKIDTILQHALSIEEQYTLEIIRNSLQEKIDFFDYCITGLPYEIEKADWTFTEDEKKIDKKLEQLDEKLFWGRVLDNKQEVALCYSEMVQDYLANYKNLSEREIILYEGFLNKIELHLPPNYKYIEKEKPTNLLEEYSHYRLKDTRYIPGFNFFIESLQGLEHSAVQNDAAGSISDGPSTIEFPTSKKFKTLDLARILKLNIHEIETHSITDHNHKQLIGRIRWAKSIQKDEGTAIFMENILQFGNKLLRYDTATDKVIYDITKFTLGSNLNFTLMWELCTNEELKLFLELHAKLLGSKVSPTTRFLRLKRSNKNRVQYKDSTYTRGLIKAVSEINKYIISEGKEGIKPEHLFLWKISFEETKKLYQIKKEKQKREEKVYTLSPLFTSDAVIYSIECKKKGIPVYEESFLRYLQDKYPFFNFKEKKIKLISHSIKRNITSVVNIFMNKMNTTPLDQNENFVLMLQNSTRKLSDKRRSIVEKYIGTESR